MISVFYSTRKIDNEHLTYLRGTCVLENVEIIPFENNGQTSLAKAYNQAILESSNDILVCIHDDVFLSKGWDKIIFDAFQKSNYGILGVAGTTRLPETGMWWQDRHLMVGSVHHRDEKGAWKDSEYSESIPSTIQEVLAVDGLFIAIKKDRIKANFVEEFEGFHFYDIPFCVENHLRGVKIGVVSDFKVRHASIGNVSKEWEYSRRKFAETYKNKLPLELFPQPHIENKIVELPREPKLAIIIPSKDNFELLKSCIESIRFTTQYRNYKIYVADTGSESDTISKLRQLNGERVIDKLIEYDFYHFAKINNDVVKNHVESDTELLLFVNDDILMMNDAISIMVAEYLKSPKTTGTIGCRLHYLNNKIQHAGIVCYVNKGRIGLSHHGIQTFYHGFKTKNDVLGSTGAFLMIRKVLFDGIKGFEEKTYDCMEDVILNLECIIRNYKNIYVGSAMCYHFESTTRSKNPKKVELEVKDMNEHVLPKISKNINKLKKYIQVIR
jgi:GT2 family glycosyltransferase